MTTAGPVRTCIGCRERTTSDRMVRIVADRDHRTVRVDVARRLPGRGAHLHPRTDCLERAVRRRAVTRALRVDGPLALDDLAAYVQDQHSSTDSTEHSTEHSTENHPGPAPDARKAERR